MSQCKKQVKFFDTPNVLSWTSTDNEVTLYETTVKLCKCGKSYVTVDSAIAAEVSNVHISSSANIRYK